RLGGVQPQTALGLVASGLGLALIQKSMLRGAGESITVRELPWHEASVRLWAAWHLTDLRPVVPSFRELVLSGAGTG
ncbi:LysR substrate-binding domain-containing protein, partial [Streptomyces olivaceoviridis]